MSDYTLSAKLEAQDVSYSSTLRKASGETDHLAQVTEKAGRAQAQAQSRMAGTAQAAGQVAGAVRPLAIAFAGAAVASGAASMKFEETFAKSVGLAGLAANKVGEVEEATKRLSVATGRSPQDLAEGFYFIASAGIEGKTALDTLEAAAKGAASGLGSTAVVADAATSAINAYGAGNMTAARAVDVLTATAKQGKAEAADLAPQFGRLLPVAATLGITFEEVGAGLAFLTRNSGNAHLATTELAGIMRKLLDPSEQARKTLGQYGITADMLREKVGKEGLQKTLNDLYATFAGNTDALSSVFDDYEAFNGVLSLTGVNAEAAGKVFEALGKSTGEAGRAFDAVAGTDGFELKQSLAEIKVAAIELGDTLLPIAADIAHFVGPMASGFADLPGPIKSATLALGGATIAVYALAKGVETAAKVSESFSKLSTMSASTVGAIGAITGGLAVLALGYAEVTRSTIDLKKASDDYTSSLQDQTKAVKDLNAEFVTQQLGSKNKLGNLAAIGLTTSDFEKGATGNNKQFTELANRMRELDQSMNGTKKNADALIGSLYEMRGSAATAAAGALNAALTTDKLGASAIMAAAAAKLPTDQFETLKSVLDDGVVTTQELALSNVSLVDVLALVRDLSDETSAKSSALGAASAGAAGGMATAAGAASVLTGALSNLSSVYSTMVSASIGFERSQLNLEDADRKLAEAQEAVNTGGKSLIKTQGGGASAADSAAKAQRRLEDALRGVETANRRVEDAKRSIADAEERQTKAEETRKERVAELTEAYQHLSDIQYGKQDGKGAKDAASEVAKGERDKVAAAIDLERAKLREQQANEKYNAVASDQYATALDLAEADLDRRDAALGVLDAQDRAAKTEADLVEARRKLSGETTGYAVGSDELKDALEKARKASDDMKDSDKALEEAHRSVGDQNLALEDALRGVEDAERNVIDVQNDRITGSGGYGGMVKTQAELERDLKDALLGQKAALADVVQGAGDAALAQQAYADLLSGHVTPEADANALKTKAQIDKLKELRDNLAPGSDLRLFVDEWIAQLQRVPATVKTDLELRVLTDTAKGLVALGGNALDLIAPEDLAAITAKRAMGGSVFAGAAYLVGEHRPEIFVPDSSGYVYPSVSAGLGAIGGASGSRAGNVTTVTVNVAGNVITERELAAVVAGELERMSRR